MKKRVLALLLVFVLAMSLVGCGKTEDKPETDKEGSKVEEQEDDKKEETSDKKIAMVTDQGGIHDESFNQSAWDGIQKAKEELGVEIEYLESHKDADYVPHLETALDNENDFIWGIGFKLSKPVYDAALANPEVMYGIVDFDYNLEDNKTDFPDGSPENVVGLVFKDHESSFLVGYIAGLMTETNKVGFVGGIEGTVISRFDNGFKAGVKYAAKEQDKEIDVMVQYAESFSDATKGKAIATNMYQQGADIIFHASGATGVGVIEAAKEQDKWAIGVDMDQNHLAPDNVLTSAMKMVNHGVLNVIKDFVGEDLKGGETIYVGLKEGGVGLAPTTDKNVPADILEKAKNVEKEVIDGKITVPSNEEEYKTYLDDLK